MEAFFDIIDANPGFMSQGKSVQDPFLEKLVGQVLAQFIQPPIMVDDSRLIKIEEYHFIHGSWIVNLRMIALIYFEDIAKGLIAMPEDHPNMKYIRFTGQPILNPKITNTVH
jgi:hypothetical protein